jgi:hypothetical protein
LHPGFDTPLPRTASIAVRYEIGRRPDERSSVKIVACLALALLLAGCIPVGARVSNMYTSRPAPAGSAGA